MDQETYNKITAATSVFALLAALASTATAGLLYLLEIRERDFTLRNNATQAVRDWQLNTANLSKSGFKCIQYLSHILDQESLFDKAWNKDSYILEGKIRQEKLKDCLDRERKIEFGELDAILSTSPYVPRPITVPQNISKFVGEQAIDYLNFTEALYMPWKYKTAERCIIIEQLGVPTSKYLREIVEERSELFPATQKFLRTYPSESDITDEIANCRREKII